MGRNAKGAKLIQALEKAVEAATAPTADGRRAARKAIIFTESTRTQRYLLDLLGANGYAGQVVLFNGANADDLSHQILACWLERHRGTDRVSGARSADMRAALVDCFRDEATIMIATEAAAEGINLQFCPGGELRPALESPAHRAAYWPLPPLRAGVRRGGA